VNWSDYFPDIAPKMAGCPAPILEHELRRGAQSLFKAVPLWTVVTDPIPVSTGDENVTIPAPTPNVMIGDVLQLWLDSVVLKPITPGHVAWDNPNWMEQRGKTTGYLMEAPGILRLHPIPDLPAQVGIRARVSLYPSDTSTGLDNLMSAKYRAEIMMAATASLCLYPNKPWTNGDLAVVAAQGLSRRLEELIAQNARANVGARIPSTVRWC